MSGPILVGVDESVTARKAAERARDLAMSLNASLHVVSAHTVTHVKHDGNESIISYADEALETAKRVTVDLCTPGLTIRAATEPGTPAEALIAYGEKTGAQLIVVGNQRMRGMKRVLGSVANSVSHHATCDVYIANTYPQ